MEIYSSMKFRTKKALKAAKEIGSIAQKSKLFIPEKSGNFQYGYELTTDTDPDAEKCMFVIGIQFKPKNWIGNTLEKLYGREQYGKNEITYQWLRQDDEKGKWIDVWDFKISSRELCEDYQLGFNGHKDYDSCPCPKNFKKFCEDINSALKKYSFKA